MSYTNCIRTIAQAAGRTLSDEEVLAIYTRVHKAALDIKAGRASAADIAAGKKVSAIPGATDDIIRAAAERAAADLMHEAQVEERQAHLQVVKLAGAIDGWKRLTDAGMKPVDAVRALITRDYTGKINVESIEQRVAGHKAYFGRKLLDSWDALGRDYLGFFQDRDKLRALITELRGEDSGDALAKKGAKAFHETAEEARQAFNAAGGDIGKLDDWGMPQHHSQERVAAAGRDAWVDSILPMLDRSRYVDDLGNAWSDVELRAFLGKAWDTIATDGLANVVPGKMMGTGKMANRHGEHRQVHFKSADDVITYWERFGERTPVEILSGHVDTMARDIAFVEAFGPNPNTTYKTLRDMAVQAMATADPTKTGAAQTAGSKLDRAWNYWSGKSSSIGNLTLKKTADAIANLNTAGKLGGAALASLFGDKPMMEAVAHLNNLPAFKRWQTELALLNPANKSDRRQLQRQGLMLESIRSGLQRWGDDLGTTSATSKLANAVMRVTGMQAINDIRKGAFGLSLMGAIGDEIKAGRDFARLSDSDVRALRNYGIIEADWRVWKLAQLDDMGRGNDAVLTPDSIARISDEELKAAGFDDPATTRRDATVKLLGAVNTESEFAIVTPGWDERAQFYSGPAGERGTVMGEIARSVLQFKSFPWAMFQRSLDAVANSKGPLGKFGMGAYVIIATTLAGAMLMQTRDILSGKDPREMFNDRDWLKFWGAAFLQGGALGIYGDFLYGANQTRYGSGPIEALAGPTVGPLMELGLVQPMKAIKDNIEGKESHFLAKQFQDLKGFVPGGNIWYLKAALDHMVFQQVLEWLSPGYLASIRSRTLKDFQQDWWYMPGEFTPERGPDFGKAFGQ